MPVPDGIPAVEALLPVVAVSDDAAEGNAEEVTAGLPGAGAPLSGPEVLAESRTATRTITRIRRRPAAADKPIIRPRLEPGFEGEVKGVAGRAELAGVEPLEGYPSMEE